jgi:hypothetical protein
MRRFMQIAETAGTPTLTGRGGSNLYALCPVERAWGHVCACAVSNGEYTPEM